MTTDNRSTHWSLTINNPTAEDEEFIQQARSKGWIITGQLEQGENNTKHYQLHLNCKKQVRFSAVKKAFPRAHIEKARNVKALENYVNKEDTRIGVLAEHQEQYPTTTKLWELIFTEYDTKDKDGWLCNELMDYDIGSTELRLYRGRGDQYMSLDWFDAVIRKLILRGYYVEHHAVNPAVRSQWKNYSNELLIRARDKLRARATREDSQTARQEEEETDNNLDTTSTEYSTETEEEQNGNVLPRKTKIQKIREEDTQDSED